MKFPPPDPLPGPVAYGEKGTKIRNLDFFLLPLLPFYPTKGEMPNGKG
jgi:hypothetical protein